MVRLIFFIFIFFYPLISFGEELSYQESMIFNFIDLNKDKYISPVEINQSINLIFQLIDDNKDGKISKSEILSLKLILETLS